MAIKHAQSYGGMQVDPPWVVNTSNVTISRDTPCDFQGHRTGVDNVEYLDGKVFAYCEVCDSRIEIGRVPGGVSVLRVQALLQALGVGQSAQIDITGEMLAEYVQLREAIAEEQDRLNASVDMLDTIRLVLTKRGADFGA